MTDKCTVDQPARCSSKPHTVGYCGENFQSGAGIREDFLEEVSGEQGEKHSGLAHPMFLFLAFAEGSCSSGAWVCQP